MILTLPWHYLGLQGQWRRVAQFNYADPTVAAWGPWVVASVVGGLILLSSVALFIRNLLSLHLSPATVPLPPPSYALAAHPPQHVPKVLNGFAFWNAVVLLLMIVAYGYPIVQFFVIKPPQAMVHHAAGGS